MNLLRNLFRAFLRDMTPPRLRLRRRGRVRTVSVTLRIDTRQVDEAMNKLRDALEYHVECRSSAQMVADEIEHYARNHPPVETGRLGRSIWMSTAPRLIQNMVRAAQNEEMERIRERHEAYLCGMTVEEYRERKEREYWETRLNLPAPPIIFPDIE